LFSSLCFGIKTNLEDSTDEAPPPLAFMAGELTSQANFFLNQKEFLAGEI